MEQDRQKCRRREGDSSVQRINGNRGVFFSIIVDSFVRLDSREERIDILTFASPFASFFFPLVEKKNAAEEPVLRNFNRETIIPLLPPSFTLFVAYRCASQRRKSNQNASDNYSIEEWEIIEELTSTEHRNAVFKLAPVRRVSRIWDTREAGSRGTQIRGRFVIASGRVRFFKSYRLETSIP